MVMIGYNLVSPADKLKDIQVQNLYEMIHNSNDELSNNIKQLRAIKRIDIKQYSSMKKRLPYFVCGNFNMPFRRTENFSYIDCFVIDIDHLSGKGISMDALRLQVQNDGRVLMAYVSPGEDGLKLLFRLKEKCYDPGIFKLFYKVFVYKFSQLYSLEQVIDSRTCDVTRACFLSSDSDAYYNVNAESVDLSSYIKEDNVQDMFDLKHEMSSLEALLPQPIEEITPMIVDPDDETLEEIKQTLKLRKQKLVKEEYIYVPEILNDIILFIKQDIEKTGIIVENIRNIQYGKKLSVKLGNRVGEINLFYGKRGFTVVQSPKRGTSLELNQITADIVDLFLAENRA